MKHICTKPDDYHKLGHEYTFGPAHAMPGFVFIMETQKYAAVAMFKRKTHPFALAAIENKRLKDAL